MTTKAQSPVERCDGCGGKAGHKNGLLPYHDADGRGFCSACGKRRMADGIGTITNLVESGAQERLMRGVGPDGHATGEETQPWHDRPPVAVRDQQHDQEIVMNGTVMFQQPPPVHCTGGSPSPTSSKGQPGGLDLAIATERATPIAEAITERLTERESRCYQLRKFAGWDMQRIADHEGMTRTAVKRALARASLKVRGAIVENELRVMT